MTNNGIGIAPGIDPGAKQGVRRYSVGHERRGRGHMTHDILQRLAEAHRATISKEGDRSHKNERDPAVFFADDFETGTVEEIGKRWGEISNKKGEVVFISDDIPPGPPGKRSLQMTGTLRRWPPLFKPLSTTVTTPILHGRT